MTLTNTSVPIDTKEVSSLVKTIQGLPLSSMLKIVLLIVVLLILVRLLTGLSVRLIERSHIDKSLHGFLRTSVKIALYFVAATIVAGSLHIDVTSLIAVLSVAGLAVSLALQGALSNLASGLVILTTRPLKVGDYVSIGGSEGFVEEIGMTYTKLSAYDKRFFFIPNSTVTSSCVINYTLEGRRRVEHTITASYNCDIDRSRPPLQRPWRPFRASTRIRRSLFTSAATRTAPSPIWFGLGAATNPIGTTTMPCWRRSSAPLTVTALK